jgi:hypothetical protein
MDIGGYRERSNGFVFAISHHAPKGTFGPKVSAKLLRNSIVFLGYLASFGNFEALEE